MTRLPSPSLCHLQGQEQLESQEKTGSPALKLRRQGIPLLLTNPGFLSLGWQDIPPCPFLDPSHKQRAPPAEWALELAGGQGSSSLL